jgi:hypothetical protein
MTSRPCKIAVAGTHSTGKTTFLRRLENELARRGFSPRYVHDSAVNARDLGFPILRDHTFESTAWIMADVILVDRPVPDALGYLVAALEVTGRSLAPGRLERLEAICTAWIGEYDLTFVTHLDQDISIGSGRDDDHEFRIAAGTAVSHLLRHIAPHAKGLGAHDADDALALAISFAERHRSGG